MRLKRVSDGEYHLSHSGKTVQIMRGIDRRWTIRPLEGIQFEDKEAESYTAAKQAGEKILLSKRAAATAVSKAADPLAAIQELRRNLDELERSLKQ